MSSTCSYAANYARFLANGHALPYRLLTALLTVRSTHFMVLKCDDTLTTKYFGDPFRLGPHVRRNGRGLFSWDR